MADVPLTARLEAASTPRAGSRRLSREAARVAGFGLAGLLCTAAAWYGARQVRVPVASDLGLAGVLPPLYWAGLAGLIVLGWLALRSLRPSTAVLSTLTALLVAVVYGTPAAVDRIPRLEVSWRHLGITETILRQGHIDPHIDAYFNWPGFFAGLATVLGVSGATPTAVALVAPVVNGLLWAVAVAALVRTLTPSAHHVWLAVWLFTLADWIDQDYLSPQALSYLLYLLAVALLLRHLGAAPAEPLLRCAVRLGPLRGVRAWWLSREPTEPSGTRRVGALLLVVLLGAAIVASHQLTPFMLFATVGVLTVTGRLWTPRLLVILGLALVLWLVTAAATYLGGHPVLFAQSLSETAGATVEQRTDGSAGHVRVVEVRMLLTALVLLLGFAGALLLRLRGNRDPRPALLMVLPFGMVAVQSYGGEMLMRSTLFGLPFAAYCAAALFVPRRPRQGLAAAPAALLVTVAMAASVIVGKYGNAAFDMFSPREVHAVQVLYRVAPRGSLLVAGARATPWKSHDYATYTYAPLQDLCPVPLAPGPCVRRLQEGSHTRGGAYLLVLRSHRQALRIEGDAPAGELDAVARAAVLRGAELVYRNPDARIYRIPPRGEGARHG